MIDGVSRLKYTHKFLSKSKKEFNPIKIKAFDRSKAIPIVKVISTISNVIAQILGSFTIVFVGVTTLYPRFAVKARAKVIRSVTKIGIAVATKIIVSKPSVLEDIRVSFSHPFQKWKKNLDPDKYKNFLEYLNQKFNISNFQLLCHLSQDIPDVPLVTSDGIIYSREVFEKIDDAKIKHDLRYAYQFSQQVIYKLEQIKIELDKGTEQESFILEGINKLILQYTKNNDNVDTGYLVSLARDSNVKSASSDQLESLLKAYYPEIEENTI